MRRDELLELIAEVRRCKSETATIEVKEASGGTPAIYDTLSAFANSTTGGVILFGLERKDYSIVGVKDAGQLQETISDIARDRMKPPLSPEFTIEDFDGRIVIAAEVPTVAPGERPCFYEPKGIHGGSYIRVGNTNRQMTTYEIFSYISAHNQQITDEEPILEATLEDLDRAKLLEVIAQLVRERPQATYLRQSFEHILTRLRIAKNVEGILHPTLAGLLIFGNYPQEFAPQLVITFLRYYGVTEVEAGPRGERFLDNKKFEGPIGELLAQANSYVLASIGRSSLIKGLLRRDIPEYPEEAIREALTNAIVHRDYSHHVRGGYIQIRLFADRLEVQSPGGLYGNVTEENLEHEYSARNSALIRLMESLHLVENRGSGISAMIEAMRNANLEPPRFKDNISSFLVTFHNHTLMSPESVVWLNQFADYQINYRQRVTLVYLRRHKSITNSEYQRLNRVDQVTAYKELKGLVDVELLQSHGAGR